MQGRRPELFSSTCRASPPAIPRISVRTNAPLGDRVGRTKQPRQTETTTTTNPAQPYGSNRFTTGGAGNLEDSSMKETARFARNRVALPVRATTGTDQMFGVAAPLLAGFSLTMVGVLLQLPTSTGIRWREVALLFLLSSTLVYLLSLHAHNAAYLRASKDQFRSGSRSEEEFNRLEDAYRRIHNEHDTRARVLFGIAATPLIGGFL